MTGSSRGVNRRIFLEVSSVLVGVLAGCSVGESPEGTPEETAESPTSTPETATPTTTDPTPTATQANIPDSHLEAFELDIGRENIEVRTLSVQTAVVSLQYATTKQEYQQISAQIGRISGFFFKQVRDGWDVSRLESEAHVAGGAVFTWHARSEWYERFAAGEITADELSFKVIDTATRKDGG